MSVYTNLGIIYKIVSVFYLIKDDGHFLTFGNVVCGVGGGQEPELNYVRVNRHSYVAGRD
jgi:hypothetical protein